MKMRTQQIAELGKQLITMDNLEEALKLIAKELKKLLGADRCSVFIADEKDGILWTKFSDGIERIVVSLNSGIVGDTYTKSEPQIVNDPYNDPRFLSAIDKKSGYKTKNILTTPIYGSKRQIIGVIQLLNKIRGDFTEQDLEDLAFLSNYISGNLELMLMNEN